MAEDKEELKDVLEIRCVNGKEYFFDSNMNAWSLCDYTRREAFLWSQEMDGCSFCIDCEKASSCSNCTNCRNIKHCIDCNNCSHCDTCTYCILCTDCTECHSCDSCTGCICLCCSRNCCRTGIDDIECQTCLNSVRHYTEEPEAVIRLDNGIGFVIGRGGELNTATALEGEPNERHLLYESDVENITSAYIGALRKSKKRYNID